MKCDRLGERRKDSFQPDNERVIVCEGFHETSFVCALLKQLGIQNCDVTFPKKKEGKDGIADMVRLISAIPDVTGIAIVRDADTNADEAFKQACASYAAPFEVPKQPFVVMRGKQKTSGIFLMPGKNKTGTLEHLLLDAVFATHQPLADCIAALERCNQRSQNWSANKKAKMKMQCVIACFCERKPACSPAFIWEMGDDNPLDIASPCFQELADFLTDFSR